MLDAYAFHQNEMLDEPQAYDEAGQAHGTAATIEATLKRHLRDEEKLRYRSSCITG